MIKLFYRGYESEKCGILYSMSEGLSNPEANLKINLYGINSVNVEIKPIWKLIIEEVNLNFLNIIFTFSFFFH